MSVRKSIAPLLSDRLRVYSKYMNCRPSMVKTQPPPPSNIKIALTLDVPSLVMLTGFWHEKASGDLSYVRLKKHLRVPDAESLLSSAHLGEAVVPIPGYDYSNFFECDINENIVYELWAPRVNPALLGKLTRGRLMFFSPDTPYVRGFRSLLEVVYTAVMESKEAYVYVVSKFSTPGFLGKFLELFNGVQTKVIVATSTDNFKIEENSFGNVKIIYTRSHRKLLVILSKLGTGEWEVLPLHGSMNVFSPGTDDYLVCASTPYDLSVVTNGLVRALFVV